MITSLSLFNYRNFEKLDLAFSHPHVVLYGENGVGKTNILEAVSLFSIGKGLKKSKADEVTKLAQTPSKEGWSVNLGLTDDVCLKTGYFPQMEGGFKKKSFIQGAPIQTHVQYAEWLNILWITPETDQLFLASPSTRRKFVDRFVYAKDSGHLKRVLRFEHAVSERMKILKNYGVDESAWLDSIEKTIAEEGVSLAYARMDLLNSLSLFIPQKNENSTLISFKAYMLGDFEDLIVSVEQSSVMARYQEKLFENRRKDLLTGKTNFGPHRSDLGMIHPVKDKSVFMCSTGEQKVFLLSLLIAFMEKFCFTKDVHTIFLLDDVIAHLDEQHRAVLFKRLTQSENKNFQAWFSGTDASFFDAIKGKAQFIDVEKL